MYCDVMTSLLQSGHQVLCHGKVLALLFSMILVRLILMMYLRPDLFYRGERNRDIISL